MTLYFAYGVNMDRAGMARRCPGAVAHGPAMLVGFRFFVMREGYASVMRAPGEIVHGVLWRIGLRDLAALNAFESLDSGLYRRAMLPVRANGGRMNALIYIGRRRKKGRPQPGYLEEVVGAARGWNFPRAYINALERLASGGFRGVRAVQTGETG